MAHRHSFNTQPRKRIRQKSALQRWKTSLTWLGQALERAPKEHEDERNFFNHRIETTKREIAVLEAKGITV